MDERERHRMNEDLEYALTQGAYTHRCFSCELHPYHDDAGGGQEERMAGCLPSVLRPRLAARRCQASRRGGSSKGGTGDVVLRSQSLPSAYFTSNCAFSFSEGGRITESGTQWVEKDEQLLFPEARFDDTTSHASATGGRVRCVSPRLRQFHRHENRQPTHTNTARDTTANPTTSGRSVGGFASLPRTHAVRSRTYPCVQPVGKQSPDSQSCTICAVPIRRGQRPSTVTSAKVVQASSSAKTTQSVRFNTSSRRRMRKLAIRLSTSSSGTWLMPSSSTPSDESTIKPCTGPSVRSTAARSSARVRSVSVDTGTIVRTTNCTRIAAWSKVVRDGRPA
eukprot:Rhum_TRINITY_DN6059_c0_g2::Rhum_TRINITY_DN6059_c0_g2_i1::g.19046::m.19046